MFKNFFSKKNQDKKRVNDSTSKIDWHINESILTFNNGDAFMHYYNKNEVKDSQNPAWQNQEIYFWNSNEIFEKKSLPDEFLNFEKKYFIINEIPEYISVAVGKAMPWFGKPGGGNKYFFRYEGNPISIEEAKKLKIIFYFEYVEITDENISILNNRDNYIFQLDKSVNYKNQEFYIDNLKTSLSTLYHKGLLKVMKIK